MKKIVGYCRVSSDGQVDGNGFDRQKDAIVGWANSNNSEIVKIFYEAKTGTTFDRPVYQQMINYIKENKIDYLVIEKTDRIARTLIVQETILAEIYSIGIDVISATEGSLSGDITRVLQRQILGSFAEYEKNKLVSRLRIAREKIRHEQGKCEGEKPYSNQAVIERIKAMRSADCTWDAIAQALNGHGIPTKRGGSGRWHPASVRQVALRG